MQGLDIDDDYLALRQLNERSVDVFARPPAIYIRELHGVLTMNLVGAKAGVLVDHDVGAQ